jgi:hypothetical protein
MTVIHVTQELNSDTLQLPELKPLIGKKVEITIREVPEIPATKNGWDALLELAGKDLIDLDAIEAYREFDKQHWPVNRP